MTSTPIKGLRFLFGTMLLASACTAQSVPKAVWGRRTIRRELPARTISCWAEADAKKILGTDIEYSNRVFRWGSITTNNPVADSKIITAQQFHAENSGEGANSSQVDFQQLGIKQTRTLEVRIQHADAHVSTATNEIPGDDILLKNLDTIVLSVCNIYFEAKRDHDRK